MHCFRYDLLVAVFFFQSCTGCAFACVACVALVLYPTCGAIIGPYFYVGVESK